MAQLSVPNSIEHGTRSLRLGPAPAQPLRDSITAQARCASGRITTHTPMKRFPARSPRGNPATDSAQPSHAVEPYAAALRLHIAARAQTACE